MWYEDTNRREHRASPVTVIFLPGVTVSWIVVDQVTDRDLQQDTKGSRRSIEQAASRWSRYYRPIWRVQQLRHEHWVSLWNHHDMAARLWKLGVYLKLLLLCNITLIFKDLVCPKIIFRLTFWQVIAPSTFVIHDFHRLIHDSVFPIHITPYYFLL